MTDRKKSDSGRALWRELLSKSNVRAREALLELCQREALVIVTGAGVSQNACMPGWEQLVTSLVVHAAEEDFIEIRPPEETAQLLVGRYGALAVADWVERTLEPHELKVALRAALYGKERNQIYLPGLFAQAISLLAFAFAPDCEVFTTNYDRLVEEAYARVGRLARKSSVLKVVHLHGALTYDGQGDEEPITLSERSFARPHATTRAHYKRLEARMRSTSCLFLGCSLADPNLLRALHNAYDGNATHRHYAIFPRIGYSSRDLDRGDHNDQVEQFLEQRFEKLGVTVLWADFFAEIPQFTLELSRLKLDQAPRRAEVVDPARDLVDERFGVRAKRCSERASRRYHTHVDDSHRDDFRRGQALLREKLETVREDIEGVIRSNASGAAAKKKFDGEHLAVHLWVYRPGSSSKDATLELWASTAVTYEHNWTMQERLLYGTESSLAVRCFREARTFVTRLPTDQRSDVYGVPYDSVDPRWRTQLLVPVDRINDEFLACVGVVALSSDAPPNESALRDLYRKKTGQRSLREIVVDKLAVAASGLLDPREWPDMPEIL